MGEHPAAACPTCSNRALTLTTTVEAIPYFGEALLSAVQCEACGFRHSDFMPLTTRDPARHTLVIQTPEDLRSRVVRASTGSYNVPELGFRADPAPYSEAFVTNVEGVLDRIREVFLRARIMTDEAEDKRVLDERLEKLQAILDCRSSATLVIEDPNGHSAILSDRARVTPLTPEEARRLMGTQAEGAGEAG